MRHNRIGSRIGLLTFQRGLASIAVATAFGGLVFAAPPHLSAQESAPPTEVPSTPADPTAIPQPPAEEYVPPDASVPPVADEPSSSGDLGTPDAPRTDRAVSDRLYLGLQIEAIPEAVAAQLGQKDGLMVVDVLPDSPAAKAGLEKFDIVTRFNETPITAIDDLTNAVNAAGQAEGTLTIVHRGEEAKLSVTPEPMPEGLAVRDNVRANPLGEMFFMGPAQMLPNVPGRQVPGQLNLRGNQNIWGQFNTDQGSKKVSINIQRDGDSPAKITVIKDGEQFEATEDHLDTLPESVREEVKRFLATGMPTVRALRGIPAAPGGGAMPGLPDFAPGTPGGGVDRPEFRAMRDQMDKMREEMRLQMEQLQNDMRKMRDGQPAPDQKNGEKPAGIET